jgi:hypothetical protein
VVAEHLGVRVGELTRLPRPQALGAEAREDLPRGGEAGGVRPPPLRVLADVPLELPLLGVQRQEARRAQAEDEVHALGGTGDGACRTRTGRLIRARDALYQMS